MLGKLVDNNTAKNCVWWIGQKSKCYLLINTSKVSSTDRFVSKTQYDFDK